MQIPCHALKVHTLPPFPLSLLWKAELTAGDKQDCLWQVLDIIYFIHNYSKNPELFLKILSQYQHHT